MGGVWQDEGSCSYGNVLHLGCIGASVLVVILNHRFIVIIYHWGSLYKGYTECILLVTTTYKSSYV